jgi:carbonic anhydrase
MSYTDTLLARNQDFAREQIAAGTLMPSLPEQLPNVKAVIIGCADMRVDPSQLLELEPGEAVVMRNIGGRITPGLLQQLGLLARIGEVAQAVPGGGSEFHIVVLHHTDCGITRLANNPEMLSDYFQVPEAELPKKAFMDPEAAVAADVAVLRGVPALPPQWMISGQVYDVATGIVHVIVPAAPLRAV